MAALNKVVKKTNSPVKLGLSENGNIQKAKGPRQALFEVLTGVFWSGDNTEKVNLALSSMKELIANNDFDFMSNLIIFARKEMGMRTFPIAMVVKLAQFMREQNKSYMHMRKLVCDVISRADEINEMYAYAIAVFGDKKYVPSAIKKGVADAFNKFDEYQFGKYNRKGQVSFKDALRIVHPTPKDSAQSELFAKIMNDNLAVPYTWETELSANGQLPFGKQKSPHAIWSELVSSGKLPYMALLRNLRNIENAGGVSLIKNAAMIISNKENVARSKQFPFAFLNALENINSKCLRDAVTKAIDHSLANIPTIGGKIAIIIDVSGSMGYGNKSPFGTAILFGSAIAKSHKEQTVNIFTFSNNAKIVNNINLDSDILSISINIENKSVSRGGTEINSIIELIGDSHKDYDAVFLLSDGDVNPINTRHFGSTWVNRNWFPNATKICFNFRASATTPVATDDGWHYMCGYSDKIFDYMGFIREAGSIEKLFDKPFGQ